VIVNGAERAIEFYKLAFGTTELMRMPKLDGRVAYAEIDDSIVMLADEMREVGY
jgi:PhnB protein